jgi:hypothetical protein
MRTRSLLFGLLALPVVVFADASDGQFMGYELGTNYATTPKHIERTTLGDVVIVADDPLKPADIQEVKLFATAVSRTIGYISAASWYATESEAREVARHYAELLRVKYPDWEFGREAMDASSRIVEVNFDKAPYNLRLRLVRDEHEGSNMWRFSMGLGWQPNTDEWQALQDISTTQRSAAVATEREQILENADVRGL